MTVIDERLKEYATERQAELIDAANLHGGVRPAARELNLSPKTIRKAIDGARKKAGMAGYAPDTGVNRPLPDHLKLKGTSALVDERTGDTVLQWYKSNERADATEAILREAVDALKEEVPHAAPTAHPGYTKPDLLSVYVITDYHLGMLAWDEETGADWDSDIAEDTLYRWFASAAALCPDSEKAVLANIGDFLHYDSLDSETPTNGNVLDADTRYPRLVRAAIRAFRRVVDMLLTKHSEVHIIMAEGNHDLAGSVWLREMFATLYELEPRVTVDTSATPYYCVEHGRCMVAFHHGHKKKPEGLAEVFAAQFRETFGRTVKAYGHCGHRHHRKVMETPLMAVEQHPTLAAPDAHAARHGYLSERTASVITYHTEQGEIQRTTVPYSMIGAD